MFSISSYVAIAGDSLDPRRTADSLCKMLHERYDRITVTTTTIKAQASLFALLYKGPRTHPFIAFEHANMQICRNDRRMEIRYNLGLDFQVLIAVCLAALFALMGWVEQDFIGGAEVGLAIALAISTLNLIYTSLSARRRIRDAAVVSQRLSNSGRISDNESFTK